MNFKDWLNELSDNTPELQDFIQKLDRFLDNGRFKGNDFETAIERGIVAAGEAAQETNGANADA